MKETKKKKNPNEERFELYTSVMPILGAALVDAYAYDPLNEKGEIEIVDFIYQQLKRSDYPLKKNLITPILRQAYEYIECEEAQPYQEKK